ncbi:MAG: ferric iron uptake transcriptional regulator [Gammaproteobacteria bacterium]|nr:ferric iron uptake transcriptional regulator [Gammaproteobacteria bacterium]
MNWSLWLKSGQKEEVLGLGRENLKSAGLKVTLPRLKILNLLEECNGRHMSAETLHQELVSSGEDVGLATVYRVLTQFEAAGLVSRHNFESGQAVFELDEGEHHDHILCVRCGKVEEFVDDVIEKRQQEIVDEHGFEMTDHHLTIYGVCPDCRKKGQ